LPLHLVGEDPDSPEGRCPAVYVDPDTGDFYFQGRLIEDPQVIAEVARHGNLHSDEAVVRLPARMASLVAAAAAGTYEPEQLGHGPADSSEVLQSAKRAALHLEMRDTYGPSHPAYQDFRAGGTGRYEMTKWRGIVQDTVGRGVTIRRARVVSEPPSDYIRWEHMLTEQNVAAGEDVRWLPRERAWDLVLPAADFWLFDHKLVMFNFCAGDGTEIEQEKSSNDPDIVARCLLAFEQVWGRAIPHGQYQLPDKNDQQ